MKNILLQLWSDERGFVQSAELVLIAVILVIGMVVGLATVRDSHTQELGDSAAAIGEVDQSYSIAILANGVDPMVGTEITVADPVVTFTRDFGDVEVVSTINNYGYTDETDVGDGDDTAGSPPAGIVIAGVGAPSTADENSIPDPIPAP